MTKYVYPPRPRTTIHPRQLPEEDERGVWLCQRKFNGDRCVSLIQDGRVHLGNRRGKWHNRHIHSEIQRDLLSLKFAGKTTRLDGELIESLNVLVLFDILEYGKYLFGVTQTERLDLLGDICGQSEQSSQNTQTSQNGISLALQVSEHIWLAQNWQSNFSEHFSECIDHDLIEGLVLRQKVSTLDHWGDKEYEVEWQLRCRKNSRKYRF